MTLDDRGLVDLARQAYTATPTWTFGDVRAVLTQVPGATVIAFRGTDPENVEDWLRDLDAIPVYDAFLGWCHRGFYEGARSAVPVALQAAQTYPLVITGHSLGGALAGLLGGLLLTKGVRPRAIVTFGAPRVFGPQGAGFMSTLPVRQYRHCDDIVPTVPSFFRHVREPLIALPDFDQGDPIENHSVTYYEQALDASLEAAK